MFLQQSGEPFHNWTWIRKQNFKLLVGQKSTKNFSNVSLSAQPQISSDILVLGFNFFVFN